MPKGPFMGSSDWGGGLFASDPHPALRAPSPKGRLWERENAISHWDDGCGILPAEEMTPLSEGKAGLGTKPPKQRFPSRAGRGQGGGPLRRNAPCSGGCKSFSRGKPLRKKPPLAKEVARPKAASEDCVQATLIRRCAPPSREERLLERVSAEPILQLFFGSFFSLEKKEQGGETNEC